jgi:flagellin-like protein
MNFRPKYKNGVSPVVGVILMVAVTVALVALITVIAFNINSGTENPSSAAVQLSNGDSITLLTELDNSEKLEVLVDGTSIGQLSEVGDAVRITSDKRHTVVSKSGDENGQVIKVIEKDSINVDSVATLDGSSGGTLDSTIRIGTVKVGEVSP